MMLTNDDRKYGDMPADIGNGELVACRKRDGKARARRWIPN